MSKTDFVHPFSIEEIRIVLNCSSLDLHLSPLWGAETADHRLKIRQFLISNIHASGGLETAEDILDLDKIPQSAIKKISITHCPDYGAIAFAQFPVGIDIENISRVREAAVKRIASPPEFANAVPPASLWVAKEAIYKALRSFQQPATVSQIKTVNWQKLDSQSETFELGNHRDFLAPAGKGLVLRNNSHALAIFVFQS